MPPVFDRLPRLPRTSRTAASLAVLALVIGVIGGLVTAAPAGAAPPTPTFTTTPGGSFNDGDNLLPELALVNGDSFPDIITGGGSGLQVELNNGDGTFAAPYLVSTPGSFTISVGDVNGDGNVDVIGARINLIRVSLGDGNGGFSPAPVGTSVLPTGWYPATVIGDFDGNAFPDLAISKWDGGVDLYSGNGTGAFTYVTSVGSSGGSNLNAEGADINGDGRTDLVITQFNDGQTSVLLSDGTAFGFHPEQQYGVGGMSTALVDINADGHPDIAHGGNTVGVLVYDPLTSLFTERAAAGSGYAEGVSAADLNGDGLIDLAAGEGPANEVAIYLNDGAGGFVTSPVAYPYGSYSHGQQAGDLNNDLRPDLVVTSYNIRNTVLLNTSPAVLATITDQPDDQTVLSGNTATFAAAATSSTPHTVQWQLSTDGGGSYADIAGATADSYVTPATTSADTGNRYRAVYSSFGGTVQTTAATLTVATVPSVTTDPQSQTVDAGQPATFTAAATGVPTPSVQWQVSADNGGSYADIGGATTTTYAIPAVTDSQDGNLYRAVFTSIGGTDTTAPAELTVNPAPVVAPSAVRNVVATNTGPGQLTVTWDAPADEGTSPITGFDVGYGNGVSGNGRTVAADARSAVFDGLADGTYTASVTALSAAGQGAAGAVVAVTVATAPTSTTATDLAAAADQSLPRTGTDNGAVSALALGLLTLGGGFAFAGRRRRHR